MSWEWICLCLGLCYAGIVFYAVFYRHIFCCIVLAFSLGMTHADKLYKAESSILKDFINTTPKEQGHGE